MTELHGLTRRMYPTPDTWYLRGVKRGELNGRTAEATKQTASRCMVLKLLKTARRLVTGGGIVGVQARLRGVLAFPLGPAPRLRLGPRVELVNRACISLGADVALAGNSVLNASGVHGRIAIGANSHVDCFCVLYGQGGITIGRGCAIAAGVIVYSQSNQYRSDPSAEVLSQDTVYAPVAIGDDVWIGTGARILPGVNVGSHAVIAAGAVVRSDVPEWAVVAGVPARILHDRRAAAPHGQDQLRTTQTPQ